MKQNDRPKFRKYQFAEKEAEGYIGYQNGFTITNMIPILEGGKPPRGQQFNQILKDITAVTQYATVGGTFSYNPDVTNATGYPKNAIICIDDIGLYRSLKDDNKEQYTVTTAWHPILMDKLLQIKAQ